ncbi:MAG TPA: glycosyltransferase [Usitatibacter sp.]|jgi:glycosyltransferase involved in cell wall biosynthesis|nr:glycosyltransferase [Usitatibacter sp.]
MISFVVPAYNEEKYLGPTLDAVHAAARAAGEDYEIVVADDASTDATAGIAAQHGARVVRVDNRQIAATRNAGARAATGDRIIFVDADTTVNPALIAEALMAFRGGAVGGGAPVRIDPAPRWAHAFMKLFVPLYFGLARWAAGCFVFCTREAFEAAGGFDERYYASEEVHFSKALKRVGRFVMLKTFVVSSARKLEGRSAGQMLRITAWVLAGGDRGLRRRGSHTAFWYPDRR